MTTREQITLPENKNLSRYDDSSDLILAIRFSKLGKNFEIAKELLEKYERINKIDENGVTLLINILLFDTEYVNSDLIKIIIERGSHVNKLFNPIISMLDQFTSGYPIKSLNEVKDFVKKQAINYVPLTMAASNKDIVKLLLEKGANIDQQDTYGDTLLIKTVANNDCEIVKLALEYKANVNLLDNDGRSALFYATSRGKTEYVKLLLDAGANINSEKCCPFTKAISDYIDGFFTDRVVNVFFEKGAKIEMLKNNGIDILKNAIYNNNHNVCELLVNNGVDVNKEINGISALNYAIKNSMNDSLLIVIKYMIEKGGKVDKVHSLKITNINNKKLIKIFEINENELLIKAVKSKNINMIKLLLKEGNGNDDILMEIIRMNDLDLLKLYCDNYKTKLARNDILNALIDDTINCDILDFIYGKF